MTPRWYTSRSISFGLAGWVMLIVSWLCLPRQSPWVGWVTTDSTYGVQREPAVLNFSYGDLTHPELRRISISWRGPWAGSSRWEDPLPVKFFGPAVWYNNSGGWHAVIVGIWFIISIYTAVWLGGMALWHRRKKRIMADPLGRGVNPAAAHVTAGKTS